MIFVLAGTQEARETIGLLKKQGYDIGASVVTDYGYELLADMGIKYLHQGPLNREELVKCLKEKGILFLVDATHPYAGQVSPMAIEVAAELGIKYIRLERNSCSLPEHDLITKISSLEDIKKHLKEGQKVFSTLGSKNLSQLAGMVKEIGAKLTARILPVSSSLRICEEIGLGAEQIVALKGPFSEELNMALFKAYGAEVILTKESGEIGGFDHKISAGIKLGIEVIVLTRPELNYPLLVNTPKEVLKHIS